MHEAESNSETDVSTDEKRINWTTLIWIFPLHQIVGTVGVLVLANALTHAVFSASRAQWILNEIPYFPVPVALAFINGFYLQRRYGHRVMQWVWVLPVLVGPYMFDRSYSVSELFARPWGAPCEPTVHCIAFRTWEALVCTALSYSFGAYLATKRKALHDY